MESRLQSSNSGQDSSNPDWWIFTEKPLQIVSRFKLQDIEAVSFTSRQPEVHWHFGKFTSIESQENVKKDVLCCGKDYFGTCLQQQDFQSIKSPSVTPVQYWKCEKCQRLACLRCLQASFLIKQKMQQVDQRETKI